MGILQYLVDLLPKRNPVDETIQRETILQSKIYEEGKREGREEAIKDYEKHWRAWMDNETARRMNVLFMEDGYDVIQQGYRPSKDDISQLVPMLLAPQYPVFKKIVLGYAQNAYRMAGALGSKNEDGRPHAALANLITGFLTALEALSLKHESPPKDEWTA